MNWTTLVLRDGISLKVKEDIHFISNELNAYGKKAFRVTQIEQRPSLSKPKHVDFILTDTLIVSSNVLYVY